MIVQRPFSTVVAALLLSVDPGGMAYAEPDDSLTVLSVNQQTVQYQSGRDTVTAVLFIPEGDQQRPGVLVIHEWWGLNDWVKESAQRIAERGYVTMAIDLYRVRGAQR